MKTPQTDSMMRLAGSMKPGAVVVNVQFARELEAELNEARRESERRRVDILRWMHCCKLLNRNK